jgi:pimeloyl-ACP methyl ester carboxylesterase
VVKKLFLIVGFCFTLPAYAVEWLSYTINVNQHQLHYYQGGSGTPVFLLTGYATTSNFWSKPFVECLANKHTVYLLDYWGINTPNQDVPGNVSIQSMADDSFMLAKTMKAKSPVFIGWSMGGAVVQQIGFSYADDIKKAVLISPLTINNQPAANALDDELPHPLITYNDVLNYVFDNNLYKYRKKQLNYYKSSLFASHERLFPGEEVSENQVIAMNDWATSPATLNAAKKSEAEYLFMIPNQDKMLLPSKTLSDALLFKHAKVVKFDGSGHDISLQAPDEACSQIEEFI